jgi:glycosyltransferase involved in cell wall biosynthesis
MTGTDPTESTEPMARASTDVTVVICAYTEDRWDDLVLAVESIAGQSPAPRKLIVVVDHNERLLARVRARFPEHRSVPNQEQQGLSGARNTAVRLATGDVIAFLDDDARARPGWLAAMAALFGDPRVLCVGGRVNPIWPGERPRWFPAEFDWVVGCSYIGLPSRVAPVRNPIGSAMAFRTGPLRAVPGFDTSIGRVGTTPLGCEETELTIRLQRANPSGVVLYDPAIVADHRVTPARTSARYFRSRCWSEGVSKAVVRRKVGASEALSAERAYVSRVLPMGLLRGLASPPHGWLRASAIAVGLAWTGAGYLTTLARTRGSVRAEAGDATPIEQIAEDVSGGS